jgi:hypothetical protein
MTKKRNIRGVWHALALINSLVRTIRMRGTVAISALLSAFLSGVSAQPSTGSILHVELVNATFYFRGFCNPSTQGRNPAKLSDPTLNAFSTGVGIADIVSVNGQTVKGTAIESVDGPALSPNPSTTSGIGDFTVGLSASSWDLTFLNPDSTLIGTVYIIGHGGGPPPPGAPREITGAAYTVTGGTGPFFGARGYFRPVQDTVSGERQTTDCEDPAFRRVNADAGGNKRHAVLYLITLTQPQIVVTGNTPAVVHAIDNTLVTAANPAKAGETLTLYASGLGPTRPGIDPGQPFPSNPLQVVNSPVQVLVSENPAEVLYAGGYPGAIDGYQVNFRIPDGTPAGQIPLQLTSAWLSGPPVTIPVQ